MVFYLALLTWSDKYSVNVKEIDDQHKKLIALLNELHGAMSVGKGKDAMSAVLKNLIDYTAYHFSTEEKYMQQFNYPGYVYHKGEHSDFVKQVLDFQRKFEAGQTSVTIDVIKFLNGWVTDHIQGTDAKYGPFFNKNGLK